MLTEDGTVLRPPAVDCSGIVIRYGHTLAVDNLSFVAHPGQVVALLGPNGAGKTSTVEALEGYRTLDGGSARVLGLDPRRHHAELVGRIGVMLQRGGIYPMLGSAQVLHLFAAYYDDPDDPDQLIERVGLGPVRRTPWRRLSGGEQQRLSLALALVGKPEVLFLDEPTAGVDPEGRIVVRDIIADQRARGICVVLTTHELDEAERLADQVVIIDGGKKLAEGSPADLASGTADGSIRFTTAAGIDTGALCSALVGALGPGTTVMEDRPGAYRLVTATGVAPPTAIAALTGWLATHDLTVGDLRTGHSLEEAYLAITGSGRDALSDPTGAVTPPLDPVGGRDRGRNRNRNGNRNRGRGAETGAETGTGCPPGAGHVHRPARPVRPLVAQIRAEVTMIATNGETVFLTLGIPVVFLLFFSGVHVLPTGTRHPVDFLVPGILALAVMSTSMTALGIGTGFDRGYGVLKRLGATPLGRPRLLSAKIVTVIGVEIVQAAVLVAVGFALGWSPGSGSGGNGDGGSGVLVGAAVGAIVLGTVAFGGIGLLLAGTLKPLVNLAVVNALFVVLLLLGGMLIPLAKLPGWLAGVSKVLPAAALADALHHALGSNTAVSVHDWIVLIVWAVLAPTAAAALFRWE